MDTAAEKPKSLVILSDRCKDLRRRFDFLQRQAQNRGDLMEFMMKSLPIMSEHRAVEKEIEALESKKPMDAQDSDKPHPDIERIRARLASIASDISAISPGISKPVSKTHTSVSDPDTDNWPPAASSATSQSDNAVVACRQSRLKHLDTCTYKRINHFREYLRQQQAKSRTHIHKHVLDALRNEIHKHRLDIDSLKPAVTRRLLRKLGLSKYYEHVPAITNQLNPKYKPINIPSEREYELCDMFMKTEIPFGRHKHEVKSGRKNFMSYPYVSYKLCELRGWDEYLPAFELLKSDELLVIQDCWWRKICKDLAWEFIPTVGSAIKWEIKPRTTCKPKLTEVN